MAQITVDPKACVKCGACVDVCFGARVFEMTDAGSHPVRPHACWACGQCVAVCPTDAIDHDLFPLEECPIVESGDLPSIDALTAAFRFRRSVRAFESKPVPRETVRELVSIGRWGPTAHNSQGLDWMAFDDRTRIAELSKATIDGMRRFARLAANPLVGLLLGIAVGREGVDQLRKGRPAIERMAARLDEGEDPIFYHAPVVLVGHTRKGNTFGRDDAIYATYNLMLAGERLGLGACQIGFFQAVVARSSGLRRAIGIPDGRAPQVAIALGFARHTFRRVPPRRIPDLAWNPR